MNGLRETKKENRKARIFEAALHLFDELGYEGTSMERIAHSANLGVGTLYNYYPSKLSLLFSIIQAGAGHYVSELDEVLQGASDFRSAVQSFLAIYLKSFSTYGKRIWSEVFREAFFREPTMLAHIGAIDEPFVAKLQELLLLFQIRGTLKKTMDCYTAASVLYSLLCCHIIRYVSNVDMTSDQLVAHLKKEIAVVIDGLLA